MGKFIRHTLKLALLIIGMLIALDILYTQAFLQTGKKTKLNWVLNMKDQQLDYIILGSSRVLFHIDSDLINDSTGLVGYNLGEPDYGLNESLLLLELFYEQGNKAKDVFIQLDNNWNETTPNELGSAGFMPFIHKKNIRNHYAQYGLKYKFYSFLPFVRYMHYAHAIGFRGLINALLNDQPRSSTYGYDNLKGNIKPEEIKTESFCPSPCNPIADKMIQLTKVNHGKIIFFTAPTLKYKQKDFEPLSTKVVNYTNFANSISDTSLFYDPIHLNDKGADKFTKDFMHHYYKEKSRGQTYNSQTAHSINVKK